MFIRHDLPYRAIAFHGERAPWIGGDLQTMRNHLLRLTPPIEDGTPMRIELSDGDALLGIFHETTHPKSKGIIIIVHGLAGDCDSSYVRHLARDALHSGYDALRLNLRGAGAGSALAKSNYHAGRADDLAATCHHLAETFPEKDLYLCAYSLGGTMAVNLVSRYHPPAALKAVASFCAPIDMTDSARRFHEPRNHLYNRHFTNSLISLAIARLQDDAATIPAGLTEARLRAIKSVREFDDIFTSKIAGYQDADDYYRGTTPLRDLDKITIPTLLVHSDNDPLIPASAYHKLESHKALFCVITKGGGHVGFHGRKQPFDCWQSQMALQFFNTQRQR